MELYTKADCGCYIDGAIERSKPEIISILLNMFLAPSELAEVRELIANVGIIADYDQIIDELTGLLNTMNCAGDVNFVWHDGNLLLVDNSELE